MRTAVITILLMVCTVSCVYAESTYTITATDEQKLWITRSLRVIPSEKENPFIGKTPQQIAQLLFDQGVRDVKQAVIRRYKDLMSDSEINSVMEATD